MRTTITLTPDAEAIIRRAMAERGMTFKEAVNDAIVRSARDQQPVDISWPTYDLGIALDAAELKQMLQDLDDQEYLEKVAREEAYRLERLAAGSAGAATSTIRRRPA